MKEYRYTVCFEPAEGGGYNVVVPAIPEICTLGETDEEARAMAAEAIRCCLENALRLGEDIPEDITHHREPLMERLAVKLEAA